ncbi:hypothetical protein [Actinoallomurus acaciae]|uniref:Uncharacterized protein n=1 Tax=Actinoallomurus acaciae TaxID=502577 RepID=A0ABV5YRD5_9ACTN
MNPSPPPYGPGPAGPPRPWAPPPRRPRRGCVPLVVLGALFVIVVAVIGGAYYTSDYRPRHYLKDWSQRAGTPQGRFTSTSLGGDNHRFTMVYSEQCDTSVPCDPPPLKAVGDWIENDGGDVDDDTITRCFRDGTSFEYHHGEHWVDIQCDRVDSLLRYRFTAVFGY